MSDFVTVSIDGASVQVPTGATVAAAVLMSGRTAFRSSVTGEPRGPLCGMGICFECRVSIENLDHCRSCQILCHEGMKVRTV